MRQDRSGLAPVDWAYTEAGPSDCSSTNHISNSKQVENSGTKEDMGPISVLTRMSLFAVTICCAFRAVAYQALSGVEKLRGVIPCVSPHFE